MLATIIPLMTLAVIIAVFTIGLWPRKKPSTAPWPPYPVIDASEEEMRRRAEELRDMLSREPFGAARATALWQRLMKAPRGDGLIHEFHRDFCGHGLIHRDGGVVLCDILDGRGDDSPAIASWNRREDFVAFFARQSDFSCSGWDPEEPIFHTDDEWYRNNQRLTRRIIDAFLA